MTETEKVVELEVAEAYKNDVGRGIARIDTQTMNELGVEAGDIILIEGQSKAAAVVWRARPEDEGLKVIRIDGITRNNAGVGLGDKVKVKKADAKIAISLTIAPTEEIRFASDPEMFFKERMYGKAYIKGNKLVVNILGTPLYFIVTSTQPKGVVIVGNETRIHVSEKPVSETAHRIPTVTYEDIGGLKEEIMKIREMVELPLKHPEIFETLNITPPKGVLLYGPPGTGKTLLAKAVANEAEANFFSINGPEIMNKYYGESERALRDIFEEAEKNAPSIIFIDEIDAIAPRREEAHGDVERRVVAQLLTLMDGLKGRGQVIVIGATNRPDDIDPALRRPGRFDREIEIGVPDRNARKEILQIKTRGMPLDESVDLDKIADLTHGYTGADIEALVKEAALRAVRRIVPDIAKFEGRKLPTEILRKLKVSMDDFMHAYKIVHPSALREVLIQKPKVKWEDIGDLEDVKQQLREVVEWPLKYPKDFEKLGIKPPKGILLHGPPGTGKTLLAKAVANEAEANFIAVKGPELISKWVGESEKHIREIFRKARQAAPTIIFFDEIDSIASARGRGLDAGVTERMVNQLLTELDGIEELERVVVIAATNRLDMVDPALLRPGRFDRVIEIPMPDEKARLEIFKVHTRSMPLGKDVWEFIKKIVKDKESLKDEILSKYKLKDEEIKEEFNKINSEDDVNEFIKKYKDKIKDKKSFEKDVLQMLELLEYTMEGFTGADIEAVVKEAGMEALREARKKGEEIDKVKKEHFMRAIKKVKETINRRK